MLQTHAKSSANIQRNALTLNNSTRKERIQSCQYDLDNKMRGNMENNRQKAIHNKSPSLSYSKWLDNYGQQILTFEKNRLKKKIASSRYMQVEMNIKQKMFRKLNYQLNNQLQPNRQPQTYIHTQPSNSMTISKELSLRIQHNTSNKGRNIRSALAQGKSDINDSTKPLVEHKRAKSAIMVSTNSKDKEYQKKSIEFRMNNPLVIYPLWNKLKIKRVDDNPNVLANIIAKKNKCMQKDELYKFVRVLAHRRSVSNQHLRQ